MKSFGTTLGLKWPFDGVNDFPNLKTHKSSATNCVAS
jgi:hypothetical protein